MPRRLSDVEWGTFLSEVNVRGLQLPPWGGIVEWRQMLVLVYIGPTGEIFTTDVSDRADLLNTIPRQYDPTASTWYYQLPQELMNSIVSDADTAATLAATGLQKVGDVVVDVASTAGKAAGAAAGGATGPVLKQLTIPLIIAAVILGIIYVFPFLSRGRA